MPDRRDLPPLRRMPVRDAVAALDDARAHGMELGRPLDLVAVVLGFDTPKRGPEEPVPTGQ